MLRLMIAVLLSGLLFVGCGDDDTSSANNNNPDAGTQRDGSAGTDGQALDAQVEVECTPTIDQCDVGQDCLCCGSIGPMAICVCTTPCGSANDCTDPVLPHCNQPDPTTPGICTSADFNCCWTCQ